MYPTRPPATPPTMSPSLRAFHPMKDNNYDAVKTGYVGAIIPARTPHFAVRGPTTHAASPSEQPTTASWSTATRYPLPHWPLSAHIPTASHRSPSRRRVESMGGNPPSHTCILPPSRASQRRPHGLYPPAPLRDTPQPLRRRQGFPGWHNLARQLALYLTMPSPLADGFCDLPENYRALSRRLPVHRRRPPSTGPTAATSKPNPTATSP